MLRYDRFANGEFDPRRSRKRIRTILFDVGTRRTTSHNMDRSADIRDGDLSLAACCKRLNEAAKVKTDLRQIGKGAERCIGLGAEAKLKKFTAGLETCSRT